MTTPAFVSDAPSPAPSPAPAPLGLVALPDVPAVHRLPNAYKILLENLLRHRDHPWVLPAHIEAVIGWSPDDAGQPEVPFFPARVLFQDYTAVPAFADLAAIREAVLAAGGDPSQVNPAVPVHVVVDHSLTVDEHGHPGARARNTELEYQRNAERYRFLRWVRRAFANTEVLPPGAGILHQVNLEHLADVITTREGLAVPDTVLGADSHTTMINALGVLGWGVGGIEAESVMLGEPVALRLPPVIGVELVGALPEGSGATDLVLALAQRLRRMDTVGKFVEFHGPGLANLPVPDRATVANMSPEFGSTCALFPIDRQTLAYLAATGRPAEQIALVERYAREQGLWPDATRHTDYSEHVLFDLSQVRPCVAGPNRPHDRVEIAELPAQLRADAQWRADAPTRDHDATDRPAPADGGIVLAAITSCTNTANPGLMLRAGLLARNAVERGLRPPPWTKTTLAPGSPVVMDYLDRAGLSPYLAKLGFHVVGFGCTTCIGNSGPLAEGVTEQIAREDIRAAAVLSGNRNFEGRIHPDVALAYLASPPLVVAYALAGTVDIDLTTQPIGQDESGEAVYLRDIWPSDEQTAQAAARSLAPEDYVAARAAAKTGDEHWRALPESDGALFAWDPDSTYIRRPPFADGVIAQPPALREIRDARVLALFGDGITTDLISPSGLIPPSSPAGRYLGGNGVAQRDFNSYGSRRGNHEAAARATFANRRLRNLLVDREGGHTVDHLTGETLPLYDAAVRYAEAGVPLVILAGHAYGTGSSRDWAAKGTNLLGVRAVIARSFERIHRSNLIGMGVLPLRFDPDQSIETLGLTGTEPISIEGVPRFAHNSWPRRLRVTAGEKSFEVNVCIDTEQEAAQYRHGGIIPYILRQALRREPRN